MKHTKFQTCLGRRSPKRPVGDFAKQKKKHTRQNRFLYVKLRGYHSWLKSLSILLCDSAYSRWWWLVAKSCPMYWCMFMNSVRFNLQKLRLLLQLFNSPRSSRWLQFMGSMGFLWRLMRWWDELQIPRMHQPSSSARRKRLLWTRV